MRGLTQTQLDSVEASIRALYGQASNRGLAFHTWKHVAFVATNAATFAEELSVVPNFARVCGLVHDLNYFVEADSIPEVGMTLRREILLSAGADEAFCSTVEGVVIEAHTAYRHREISPAAMALSDADTLFKALPITPIVFAARYMRQTGNSLNHLASKVVREQKPLLDAGFYFYTDHAKRRYLRWAETNIALWENVLEWFESEAYVAELLDD
jgi:uncharacterized protein